MTYSLETSPQWVRDSATNELCGFKDSHDGEVRFLDTFESQLQWEDLRFPAQGINPAGSSASATIDNSAYFGTLLFATNAVNIIGGVAQMPHSWAKGTAVHPHVHWSKTTSATGGVVWEIAYSVADIGGTFGAYSTFVAGTAVVADGNTAEKHALVSFPAIDMTGMKESTMIAWKIQRNVAATADTYAADARLWEFDIHYQSDKRGTTSETPT